MPQLELDAQEAAVLKEALESATRELGYEIANTDNKDFRDDLKAKKATLQSLAEKLGSA